MQRFNRSITLSLILGIATIAIVIIFLIVIICNFSLLGLSNFLACLLALIFILFIGLVCFQIDDNTYEIKKLKEYNYIKSLTIDEINKEIEQANTRIKKNN